MEGFGQEKAKKRAAIFHGKSTVIAKENIDAAGLKDDGGKEGNDGNKADFT